MRKIITLVVLLFLFNILDNALMPFFSIKGVYPSLVFVFCISYSIVNDVWDGLFIGLAAGLLQDIYLSNGIGISLLTNMITCVIAAEIGKNIFKERMLIPITTVFLLNIIKNGIVFVIFYILQIKVDYKTILFNSFYNMVIAIPMYIFVLHLSSKYYMKREWNFKER